MSVPIIRKRNEDAFKKKMTFVGGTEIIFDSENQKPDERWLFAAGPDGMWMYRGKLGTIMTAEGSKVFEWTVRYNLGLLVAEEFVEGVGQLPIGGGPRGGE